MFQAFRRLFKGKSQTNKKEKLAVNVEPQTGKDVAFECYLEALRVPPHGYFWTQTAKEMYLFIAFVQDMDGEK